jgi:hypothetical protein|nr:MAG TPA: protein of unknown function (DUF5351) [Caudoviricetes sp.]
MNDNKKRINNEQELFELFCAPDNIALFKQKPYYETQCKKVFATDGRIAIMMNPSMLSESYEEIKKPVIYKVFRDSVDGYFTLEALKKVLASFEMEEEQELKEEGRECEECQGFGEVEWEYRDQYGEIHFCYRDCPVCDGEGKAEDVFESTGFMMPTDDSIVRIGKSFFRGIEAQKLLWTMEYFNVDKAEFSTSANSISFTLNNGVEIAVAPLEPYEFQNIVTLETTKQ